MLTRENSKQGQGTKKNSRSYFTWGAQESGMWSDLRGGWEPRRFPAQEQQVRRPRVGGGQLEEQRRREGRAWGRAERGRGEQVPAGLWAPATCEGGRGRQNRVLLFGTPSSGQVRPGLPAFLGDVSWAGLWSFLVPRAPHSFPQWPWWDLPVEGPCVSLNSCPSTT